MRRRLIVAGLAALLLVGGAALSLAQQDLAGGIQDLVRQMIARMEQQKKRKLAILDFTRLDGSVDDFGRYLSERLITGMFLARRFEVIERKQLDKILAELKLNPSDLVGPQNAKRLGKVYGVDAIATGSVTEMVLGVEVSARLIETETGRLFAVAVALFAKDRDVATLMGKSPGAPGPPVPPPRATEVAAPPRGPAPPGMALVPAGPFTHGPEGKEQKISLPAFLIDFYEVTNADYAKVRRHDHPAAKATHPVVNVSWGEAKGYCEAVGKRLPSEQEWEKAARGTDGRHYPWGNTYDPKKVNGEGRFGGTTPVGQFPEGRSPYGLFDMAGNVWEWTASEEGNTRVLRGGSWYSDLPRDLRAATRGTHAPGDGLADGGFRCAKAPR